MLASQLSYAGLTGIFTSPHQKHPGDSIVVLDAGTRTEMTRAAFVEARASLLLDYGTSQAAATLGPPSEFELLVAVALHCFASNKLKFLVVEVGMGGARDATNVFSGKSDFPIISVLTTVALDHQAFLGSTTIAICTEKLGIVRPAPCRFVTGVWLDQACMEIVKELPAILHIVRETEKTPPMLGSHQKRNLALVLEILKILNIPYKPEIQVHHPARMHRLRFGDTEILVDGCHNAEGIESLAEFLSSEENPPQGRRGVSSASCHRTCWIVGFTGDKAELAESLPFSTHDFVIFPKFRTDAEFMPWVCIVKPAELSRRVGQRVDECQAVSSTEEAWEICKSMNFTRVVICGSLYLCFDFLAVFEGYSNESSSE